MNRNTKIAIGDAYSPDKLDFQHVGSQTVTIRDRQVTFDIFEGGQADGERFRQVMGSFPGKNGTVMLMAVGPVDNWDEEAFEAFLESLR